MSREVHVRVCESLRGRFPWATRPVCHCKSAEEAQALWSALADRFAACKLVLHPEKTKIVYCKDKNRRGDYPNCSFDFLGFCFRARKTLWNGKPAHSFLPAASPNALKRISQTIRSWTLHHRNDRSLQDLAQMYNPSIRGWITYYGSFYRTRLRPTLKNMISMSFAGRAASSRTCGARPKDRGTGLTGFAENNQGSLPIGSYVMEMVI